MFQSLSKEQRAYLAGFLDGDGSIYIRAKPNPTYRFGFQIAPYIVLYQSAKDKEKFKEVYSLIENLGHLRVRKDGILEYIISRRNSLFRFLSLVEPFVLLKRKQLDLMKKVISLKEKASNSSDFSQLIALIDSFRELNYSKRRKKRALTP